jgi:hypothetical protein
MPAKTGKAVKRVKTEHVPTRPKIEVKEEIDEEMDSEEELPEEGAQSRSQKAPIYLKPTDIERLLNKKA